VRATRASAEIFFAAGALRVHAPSAKPNVIEAWERDQANDRIRAEYFMPGKTTLSAAHLMGGCSMGRDVSDSVTDSCGRVHGVPWLRVADSSLFTDSLEINPYLTIMALADRVAEGVLADIGAIQTTRTPPTQVSQIFAD
jgi:choline dehydrogenase-like flavoprotein